MSLKLNSLDESKIIPNFMSKSHATGSMEDLLGFLSHQRTHQKIRPQITALY